MRTLTGFLFHFIFLSFSSASIFMASNIIYPLKSVLEKPPLQMPRVSLRFDEFSLAFAALEDEYYLSSYEEEKIPSGIPATELKPTDQELIKSEAPQIQIPLISMNGAENFNEAMPLGNFSPQRPQRGTVADDKSPTAAARPQEQTISQIGIAPPHFWIQGKLELSEGLAISDPRDRLNVGWFIDGERKREGQISLRQGTYEIKVDSLDGEIIAELSDKKGFLLGEAVIDLDVLRRQRAQTGFVISGVDIKLRPYNFSFKGQTLSVYDTPSNRQIVPGAQVRVGDHDMDFRSKKDGQFEEPSVSPQSTGVVFAQQDRYRQTVLLADFSRELHIHLYPDPFMRAFFDTINLPKKLHTDGIIWGTIKRGQTPAYGYQVRMAQQNAKPIYFQMYIANPQADKTSEDGQFVFVGLGNGEYEIEVVDAFGQLVDSKLAVVRMGAVTEMNFEVADERNLSLRPFDPLSMQPKNVEFYAIGQRAPVSTQTEEILKLPTYPGQEPLLIYTKVDGADVESATFASRNKKFQEVPVLNPSWWNRIQSAYKIRAQDGVIVGFIDSDLPFEVFIDHQTEKTKILYMDQQGRTIQKASSVKPSGFIIYGVDQGLHTLILESEQGQIHSEAAYVDGEAISLMYKAF